MSARSHLSWLRLAIVLATLAVALAGSNAASAVSAPVVIDTVTVENGVATVTGAVDAELIEVNGEVVDVDSDGTFRALVDVSEELLEIELLESPAELVTIRIPLDVLLQTGGEGVLNDLVDAGISIDVPSEGFRIVDGEMPLVEGRVLNDSNLELLEVNGVDVLSRTGQHGLFSINLGSSSSSSSRETVTVVVSDRRGVSQTSTFTATRVKSTIATRAGTSVSAAGARGIVIARIALDKRLLTTPKKQLHVLVTVKDRRGYLIRGASLRLRALPSKNVANGMVRAGFTNRFGKAQFRYTVRANATTGAPAKWLTVATRAATPKASASKRVQLRLPAVQH
ncbi:MAG TPA: hypothetical protein VEW90_04815 [Gaiellaceae bacterium]|nr:hypothetical protein [Gaiellaceae bacterium]